MSATGTTYSPDGLWWWDGSAWYRAVSDDGRWAWDGRAWVARRGSSLPLALLVAGLVLLLLEIPYAFLTMVALMADPDELRTQADMDEFVRSKHQWAEAFGVVAPAIALVGLALLVVGLVLLVRSRRGRPG